MNNNKSTDKMAESNLEMLKLINRLMYVLLALALFCLVILFGPDVTIVAADAKLKIPFIDQEVSVSGFLFFGPFLLIALNLYIHLYLGSVYRLPDNIKDKSELYIFTMQHKGAKVLTGFIFYWLVPVVLMVFVWNHRFVPLFIMTDASPKFLRIVLRIFFEGILDSFA